MKNALLKAAVAFLFAVGMSLGMFPSQAWAEDFSKSCYNSEVNGSVLYSICRRLDGSYNNAKIDLNPIIENVDGVLKWQPGNFPVEIAKYTFDRDILSEEEYPDDSAQTNWKTSPLYDNATGTGAMNQSNLHPYNSTLRTGSDGKYLALSSNRERIEEVNESTWFTFSIDLMGKFDFSGQEATVDTYAFSGLNGTTSTIWTLYFRLDEGSYFTSLGTKEGQTANANSGLVGPQTISWDLTPIGVQSGKIDFVIDPVSTGGTNGVIDQRSTGFDNLIVKALPQL